MRVKKIFPDLYQCNLSEANVFFCLLEDSWLLIDTGSPGEHQSIVNAAKQIGLSMTDLKHVILTHMHPDHAGSATELRQFADFQIYMHPDDAELATMGKVLRPSTKPGPGILNRFLYRIFIAGIADEINPVAVDQTVTGDEKMAGLGDFSFIHLPGHSAGQIGVLWHRHNGVLFVADAAINVAFLATAPAYEDFSIGRESLRKIAVLDFENACLGHGRPIIGGASNKFANKWGD